MLKRWSLNGNPYVGVYCFSTNDFCILPVSAEEKDRKSFAEALDCEVLLTNIGGSPIIGSLCAGNDKGILLTSFAKKVDLELFQEHTKAAIVKDRLNAIGNLVLANNSAALVHPKLSRRTVEMVEDVLEVDVYKGTIAEKGNVGMLGCATQKGLLIHPKVTKDELELLENAFGEITIDIGTVNFGSPYIGAAMVANTTGAVVGLETTGVELNRIENCLGYLD